MFARRSHRLSRLVVCTALVVSCGALLILPGCGKSEDDGEAGGLTKVKVCYIGLTCEPPIYVAYEKGFFKEEGLDVELVKSDWDSMRDGLGLGRFDATHHLIMYLLKPIDEGLDVKLTGGIHSGCLRVQAGINTDIKKVTDLKGKRIGISHMGSPPFLFASRVLAANGMDPKNDVEWITFPADAMELALDRGQVDAVANAEPIGTILLAHEKVHKVVDQAHGPALLGRVLLRYGRQRHVCAQEPQGGGGSDPGHAQGRQVGRCQQDAPPPSCRWRRDTWRRRRS